MLNIDLRQKTSRIRKIPKDAKYKKRADRKYLIGRKYEDYLKFIEENPSLTIVQMDTVYNDITNGPFIQTFKFINTGFIFALYHKEKTSLSMTQGVYTLYEILGQDVFREQVNIILTDNGPEFYDALNMECFAGFQQTRLFYCDPMMSGQKGSLENKHKELRYILPKKVSLIDLGLKSQESLSLVLSHVNSASLKSLGNKSSLELMQFMFPNMYKALLDFGIKMIPKDEIILKPNLLNQFR